jgi:hypothetical protein
MRLKRKNSLIFGAFLLIVGLVLMFNNLGLIPLIFPVYLFSWKTLLVALGIIFIFTEKEKTAGIIMAAIGFYFLIPDIWNINPMESGLFWPLLLLAAGMSVLLSGK